MNDYLFMLGLLVLVTALAGPITVSDWRRELRNRKQQ
jgi:hypothetical protein